ncbi:MAG: hypothetical protein LBE76_08375 [Nitrososphaerota archaeon]|jgi:chromosome segregation ATPase|nr:hypothetical protein [Nitrososphaerota archaeon]
MDLLELRDRISTLPTLENRAAFLLKEIQETENNRSNLLKQYKNKSRNVERIQKEKLSVFLFKLAGKYENKLEKNQIEEINAKLAYDRVVTHLDTLVREKNELGARISALRAEEQTYQTELTNRRCKLANQLTEPNGIRYAELEKERNSIISQITEIKEAIDAIDRVKSTAKNAVEFLKSAEIWAIYDVFTRGGILSHVAKYSHIDNAEQNFHKLSSQLQELKSELRDIHNWTGLKLGEISSSQRAIDLWFDNIFTDLSVHRQIKDNTEQIHQLLCNINVIESELEAKLNTEKKKIAKNKQDEEELLLSTH